MGNLMIETKWYLLHPATLTDETLIIVLVLGKYGRDKEGTEYLLEACRIGCDLHLFQQNAPEFGHRPPHILHQKWTQVRAVTAWALFNFQLWDSFFFVQVSRR